MTAAPSNGDEFPVTRGRSRWRNLVQWIFFALVLAFLAGLVIHQWEELRTYQWHLRPIWLLTAAAALITGWIVQVALWRHLLAGLGGRLSFRIAWRIWFLSAITRYVPGNVWQPLTMTIMARGKNVRAMATLTSIVTYQLVNLLAIGFLAVLYFPLTGNIGLLADLLPPSVTRGVALLIIPLIIFLLRPGWLVQGLNWLLKKLGRPPLPLHLTTSELLIAVGLAMVMWMAIGASFLFLSIALSDLPPKAMLTSAVHLVASYPISYEIGYLSFLTPSGLGVREGVAYVLLAPIVGTATATITILAMRIWLILGELVAVGIGALLGDG